MRLVDDGCGLSATENGSIKKGIIMTIQWPPYPSVELVRGRAATAEDCEAGNAAFAAQVPSPELANLPLDVFLPRVANVESGDGDP